MLKKLFILCLIPCFLALVSCEMPEKKQEKKEQKEAEQNAPQKGAPEADMGENFED